MKTLSKRFAALACGLTLAAGAQSRAGDAKGVIAAPGPIEEPPLFSVCDIFDYATWYSNKDNPVLQKFAFTGRLQADAAFYDAEGEDSFDDVLWRRVRGGFKIGLFQNFTLHSEADFDLNNYDPTYNGLTDTYIGWSPSDAFELKVGKIGANFTLDGGTSSKKLIRLERSLLSNNLWFTSEYFSGVGISGEVGNWIYNFGAYSGDRTNPEFGEFDAGYFGLASIGYDFADAFGVEKAIVRADYVYNEEDENNGTRSLSQVGSLNSWIEQGNWGIGTDVAVGQGYFNQPDLFSFQLMPFYNLTEKVQLVSSYTYITSDGDNGVRLDRYESSVVSGRADEAHEFYAGLNYYLCGHKLKWQTGVEYTTASDNANDGGAYDGWGVTTGIRISW